MSERKPYVRAQHRLWWARWPYRGYTLRELSGVGVAVYGGVLLVGLRALASGPDAYAEFLLWLTSPAAIVLHLVLLAAMLLHTVTWFQTLPKTMPRLIVGGRLVPQQALTLVALGAALVCSAALVVIGALS
jgi:fumarate reductase subunit C